MQQTESRQDASTLAIHAGRRPDPATGALLTPIYQSTTYAQPGVGEDCPHTYSRDTNPTVSTLEGALGALEDAPPAVCFSSGMAAIAALLLESLRCGDHVVVSEVVYGGTVRLLRDILSDFDIAASFVDASDPRRVAAEFTERTRLVLVETPGNPTLRLCDLTALGELSRSTGVPLAVDNTFLTPVLQRPLDAGAQVSIYSTTKFIDGHNATVGGALISRDEERLTRLRRIRKSVGSIQAPHDAWLTLQGMKTLPLRLERHSRNAHTLALGLRQLPEVEHVVYPGLVDFPQYDLAQRQHGLHGGMLTFRIRGGSEAARRFVRELRLCTLAENLGAVESLVTHPATMTHGDVPAAQRAAVGIDDGLLRLSVGLEEPEDLLADIRTALERSAS